MKRLISILGLGFSSAVLATGTAMAGCPQPTDFPEEDGWSEVDQTVAVPEGYACDVAVTIHFVGHERTTINGEVPAEDYVPKPGDLMVGESPDEVMTLTNTKNNRSVTKRITGTFYDRVARNGKDLHSKGVGKNVFFAPGVKGIVWADGVQKFDVYNFMEPTFSLDIYKTRGKTRELCQRVGARAVWGKALPEPENVA